MSNDTSFVFCLFECLQCFAFEAAHRSPAPFRISGATSDANECWKGSDGSQLSTDRPHILRPVCDYRGIHRSSDLLSRFTETFYGRHLLGAICNGIEAGDSVNIVACLCAYRNSAKAKCYLASTHLKQQMCENEKQNALTSCYVTTNRDWSLKYRRNHKCITNVDVQLRAIISSRNTAQRNARGSRFVNGRQRISDQWWQKAGFLKSNYLYKTHACRIPANVRASV